MHLISINEFDLTIFFISHFSSFHPPFSGKKTIRRLIDWLIDWFGLFGRPFKDTIHTNILYNSVQIIHHKYGWLLSNIQFSLLWNAWYIYKLTSWIKQWSSVANTFWNVSVGELWNGRKHFNLRSWYTGYCNRKCISSSSSSIQRGPTKWFVN